MPPKDNNGKPPVWLTPTQAQQRKSNPAFCKTCDGDGLVGNTPGRESWVDWRTDPPPGPMVHQMGDITAIPCTVCGGDGMVHP